MKATDVTVESFNEDAEAAQEATKKGPVFISKGKARTHILLSDAEYQFIMRMAFLSVTPTVKNRLQTELRVTEF